MGGAMGVVWVPGGGAFVVEWLLVCWGRGLGAGRGQGEAQRTPARPPPHTHLVVSGAKGNTHVPVPAHLTTHAHALVFNPIQQG